MARNFLLALAVAAASSEALFLRGDEPTTTGTIQGHGADATDADVPEAGTTLKTSMRTSSQQQNLAPDTEKPAANDEPEVEEAVEVAVAKKVPGNTAMFWATTRGFRMLSNKGLNFFPSVNEEVIKKYMEVNNIADVKDITGLNFKAFQGMTKLTPDQYNEAMRETAEKKAAAAEAKKSAAAASPKSGKRGFNFFGFGSKKAEAAQVAQEFVDEAAGSDAEAKKEAEKDVEAIANTIVATGSKKGSTENLTNLETILVATIQAQAGDERPAADEDTAASQTTEAQ